MLLAAVVCCACAAVALLWHQPVIESPRLGTPAVCRPGDEISVTLRVPHPLAARLVRDLRLMSGKRCILLEIAGRAGPTPYRSLTARIPPGTPPGRYALCAGTGVAGLCRSNAVHVVAALPGEFRFVQMTDLGIQASDPSVAGQFASTVDEINALDPAFVLFTGDGVDKGRWEEYETLQSLLLRLDAPVICCPGNHDHKGLAGYLTTFGGPYHAVSFGDWRIFSLDSAHGRDQFTRSQLRWVTEHLINRALVQFHHPLFGRKCVDSQQERFAQLVSDVGVPAVFSGHWHVDAVFDKTGTARHDGPGFEGTKFVVTRAIGQTPRGDYEGSGHGYRVVHVKDGAIISYTVVSVPLGRVGE